MFVLYTSYTSITYDFKLIYQKRMPCKHNTLTALFMMDKCSAIDTHNLLYCTVIKNYHISPHPPLAFQTLNTISQTL